MSSRLNRVWLMPFLLLASQAWALGLGDIRLSSALNEPLRAEIELLAATPEELNNLAVQLASSETFDRYDLDRPLFLTRLQFQIVRSGTADGNIIRVTSAEPVTEPFITFLVEAAWSRGRLLREYTLLLDPPTFAPPPVTQQTQAVTAPSRAEPADSGEIRRPAPQPAPRQEPAPSRPPVQAPVQTAPAPAPAPTPAPAQEAPSQPVAEEPPASTFGEPDFDSTPGGDLVIQRGDTLWSITSRVRPDSRLTMNQTMLAIFEANPQAFDGNINMMRAGATLNIPSADDVFRISRGDALQEVRRQNAAWGGEPGIAPVVEPEEAEPTLVLVPPDEEDDLSLTDTDIDAAADEAVEDTFEDEVVDPVADRISEIEAILEDQDALIEIPSNELAALRAELTELRGEEPSAVDDEVLFEDETGEIGVEDDAVAAEDTAADDTTEPVQETAPPVVTAPARQEEGLVDTILGYLTNFWVIIGGALVVAFGVLFWFMRRAGREDEDITGVWDALDADELEPDSVASTERLRALAREEEDAIVVVETEQVPALEPDVAVDLEPEPEMPAAADTLEAPAAEEPEMPAAEPVSAEALGDTDTNKALEDTFSSETAVNLDQSDPVAEADFHMAYGLYDQAADLINGALTADPDREDLLAKLCEIYFVWGNRDGFIDAADRMKSLVGDGENPDWDKIVIMGQQIAADHEMFSGVSAEGATKAVDLSFEGGTSESAVLDMDFAGGSEDEASDVIDLGAQADDEVVADDTGQVPISPDSGTGIDFAFDEEEQDVEASITREMPAPEAEETAEMPAAEAEETAEMPTAEAKETDETSDLPAVEPTVETPTIEQQFEMEATGELPAVSEEEAPPATETDVTAEIELDDLGLDLAGLEETAVATDIADEEELSDLDDTTESQTLQIPEDLEATGTSPAIDEEDALAETGRHPEVDEEPEYEKTQVLGDDEATKVASLDDDVDEDTDVGLDTSLLDATGRTQVLSEDMAVDTTSDVTANLSDEEATMLAPGYGDEDTIESPPEEPETMLAPLDDEEEEGEFDFAKTEALPKDVFSPDMSTDETGNMPGLAGSTDMDLDLDDLTAALKVSEVGDTVNQVRDDATVEQPRIKPEESADATSETQSLAPEDLSGDLHEARTMTEVGTKLDLARAYVDMGDPAGARSILEEVLDEGDEAQKQQAQQLLDSLPS